MEKRKCKECGAEFEPKTRAQHQRYCSLRCKKRQFRKLHPQKIANPERALLLGRERKRRQYMLNPEWMKEQWRKRSLRASYKKRAESLFQQLAQLQAALKEKLG